MFLIGAAGCAPSPRAAGSTNATTGKIKPICQRKPVLATALVAELTYVRNCGGIAVCLGGDRNPETKEIAGSTGGWNWLWSGNSSSNISVTLQNSLIADAYARAQAARPANKTLRRIDYNGGVVVGSGSTVLVGATATYVECGTAPARDRN